MNMTDPIADFLTHLRNAISAGHPECRTSSSKLKVAIAKILAQEGFIEDFQEVQEAVLTQETKSEIEEKKEKKEKTGWVKRVLKIGLRYTSNKRPVIRSIQRVSKPGLRVYVGASGIPRVLGGMGIVILSTPKGVLSGETARRERLGGEVLCKVW